MPKDFAMKKKTARKKRGASRSAKKKATVPMGLWLFTVAVVLCLAGGLVYLKWLQPKAQIKPTIAKIETKQKAQSKKPDISSDEVPLYEVHKDLTTKKVEIPEEDLKLPDNYKKYYYTMPCGAFREQFRAEELKAMIAMTGSTSDMREVQSKGETWYRIQLGPFNSKRNAERVRHRLQDNGIHDCKINRHIKAD